MEDYATNFHAPNIVLSISSFSFLSTYLSTFNKVAHFPVAGLFDPDSYSKSPNTLAMFGKKILIPFNEKKYKFYKVNFPCKTVRNALDFISFYEAKSDLIEYSIEEIKAYYFNSLAHQR